MCEHSVKYTRSVWESNYLIPFGRVLPSSIEKDALIYNLSVKTYEAKVLC